LSTSGTVVAHGVTAAAMVSFSFSTPYKLAAGTTYFIAVRSDVPQNAANYLTLPASNAGTYANGQMFWDIGSGWAALAIWDLSFSIYTSQLPLNGNEDCWYTIITQEVASATSGFVLNPNGDLTQANYGFRGLYSSNTTIANTSTAGPYLGIYLSGCANLDTSFSVCRLYAKSGAVRMLDSIVCDDVTSAASIQYAEWYSQVWNNTVDNIVSMTFRMNTTSILPGTRIIVLKSNNYTSGTPTGTISTPYLKGGWTRVGSQAFTSASSGLTFTGLNGDRDVVYYMSASIKNGSSSTMQTLVRLNGDTGTNYGYQYTDANSTTLSAGRATLNSSMYPQAGGNAINTVEQFNFFLFAKSGFPRKMISQYEVGTSGTTVTSCGMACNAWTNTSGNITSLTILDAYAGTNFAPGTMFELYALRPNG
jgi:hypothetical protein